MSDPIFTHAPSGAPSAAASPAPGRPAPGAGPSFRHVLHEATGEGPHEPSPASPWALLRRAAHSIGQSERQLDRAVRSVRRGHVLDHAELLALQAGVYRHSQELELASKLVDKGTSAVRNVLSSQR